MRRIFSFLMLLSLSWTGAGAFAMDPIFPGTIYDDSVPDLKEVLGFDFGKGIAMSHEVMAYAQALAAASDRVAFTQRGYSWEGRPMGLLLISSPRNLARLDQCRQAYQALADPRKTEESSLTQLTADLPVLVWLSESVHGNEISGTDSGLFMAYHLAAARNNVAIDTLLDQTILAIELMQNPDGRDRFISYSRQTRAPGGDPDPQAAERDEPWPSGRFNHYLFDLNRDWFAMSQRETEVRVAAILEWAPHIVVDLHEMGSNSSFFAAKPSPPSNPYLGESMIKAYDEFGRVVAAALDKRGIDYFQGELFDSFYPGYGEAWPSLQGAMGVLFEQASARGLVFKRNDGKLLTHRDAVTHQAVASFAILEHAGRNRERMLRFFYDIRKRAANGTKEDNQVFLLPGQDAARMAALGRLLQKQGIEVEQIEGTIKNLAVKELGIGSESRKLDIPTGSLLIRLNQPAGTLARTLLAGHVEMDSEFIEKEQLRYARREYSQIYDVTAWSLPLAFGVPAVTASGSGWSGHGKPDIQVPHGLTRPDAQLAFLIPYSIRTGPTIAALLGQGVTIHFTAAPITHEGKVFPAGTLILKKKGNPQDLPATLQKIAAEFELSISGIDSAWFEAGPSLGSEKVLPILPHRMAMIWDSPTSPLSAGWMRYTIEQELGHAVTVLKTASLAYMSLKDYKVLLMPHASTGGLSQTLGENGTKKIKDWVRAGGVLIATGGATEWLASDSVELLSTVRELKGGKIPGEKSDEEHPKEPPADLEEMVLPREEPPRGVSGALLRAQFDTSHWLAFGMAEEQAVMVDSSRIMRPLRLDKGLNVGRFVEPARLLMSGFIAEETQAQFAHKPYVMVASHGRGLVIAFTEDPNFRAFMKGQTPLFTNALFFGPAQTLDP